MYSVHVPDSQHRKLDAKTHKAVFVGYPSGVKGYKVYDLEKKKFVVSQDVQFFEKKFDHFDEKAKSADADYADLRFIFPDMNQKNESAPDLYLSNLKPLKFKRVLSLQFKRKLNQQIKRMLNLQFKIMLNPHL